ncbi:MAG: signal peptidase II [FCB group bacterium]|nr:signal peptidase II [FCB group bacterium]
MRNYWILVIAGLVLALDQYTKWLVKTSMYLHQSIPVMGEKFFRLTYVENDGIAFGMPFGGRLFLSIFTIGAIIFLLYYLNRMKKAPAPPRIALAMVLGGAFGNLTDRLLIGRVVDFFDFDFPDFIMHRWPVFNIADSSVSAGMTVLIIYLLFFEQRYTITADSDENAGLNEESVNTNLSPSEPEHVTRSGGIDPSSSGKTAEGTD